MSVNRQDFIDAILAEPDNNEPRLVYADWLEERGDPRAEFIRAQCELTRKKISRKMRTLLQEREQTLLQAHGEQWAREDLQQDPVAPIQRRFSVETYIEERIQQELADPGGRDVHHPPLIPSQISYKRGFIGQLILSAEEFTSVQWPRLPIEEVYLTNIQPNHIHTIAERLPKNTLQTLHLSASTHLRSSKDITPDLLPAAFQMLSTIGADMTRLKSLTLHNFNQYDGPSNEEASFLGCFQATHWRKLRHFALTAQRPSFSDTLAYENHGLTGLHSLDVSHGREDNSEIEHLIESERLSSVRKIICCLCEELYNPGDLEEYGRSRGKTIIVR